MRTILLVGLVALLLPGCTPLKTVNKSADAKVFKVFVTNEKNNGRPLYNVRIPGGTEFELMHAEEIGSSLSSGVWHYNEDLRLTVPDRAGTSNDITIVTTSLKKAGRPLFNVKLPDGTIILSMYAEEIALSLHTGIWQFSKNVRIE